MRDVDDYQAADRAEAGRLVRRHPFALVVSAPPAPGGGAPEASHLPVVPAPGSDLSAGLVGAVLWGHMARANPQWQGFGGEQRVLVVFSGPSGYVPPTTYQVVPAAPTWNYAAVHVVGRVRLVQDESAALEVVTATVVALEGLREQPWDMTSSLDHFRRILPGIAAFAVEVESVTTTFKLSQDEPEHLRSRVREAFAAAPGDGPAVAAAMDAVSPSTPEECTAGPATTALRQRLEVGSSADRRAEQLAQLRRISADAASRWPAALRDVEHGELLHDERGLPH